MNVLKKFAVSLTALTTLATLGIGSFSVSANGLTKVNTNLLADTATAEDKFIVSYKNADEATAANYLIENGVSVTEAKTMMDIYKEGKSQIAALAVETPSAYSLARTTSSSLNDPIATGKNFYSTTNLSSKQHYGIVIANNDKAWTDITLRLGYTSSWVSVASSLTANMINGSSSFNVSSFPNSSLVTINGNYMGTNYTQTDNNENPEGVFDIPFNVVMTEGNQGNETYSEGTLYHKFAFSRVSSSPLTTDTTFTYQTYVNGDVNHDGLVNAIDSAYLLEYNSGTAELPYFSYTDVSVEIAKAVNDRAMDTDKNGDIAFADYIWVTQHLE